MSVRVADLSDPREVGRIDALLDRFPEATIFHRPAWLMSAARACGHQPLYLVGEHGLLPLAQLRSRLFGNVLVSTPFGVAGGIVARDGAAAAELAEVAWTIASERDLGGVELRGGLIPIGWREDSATYLGFSRSLAPDDAAELAAIPRKQRAEVRRALDSAMTTDLGDRDAHFRVYAESVRNLGTPVFPRRLFAAVLDAFGDDADVLTVRHEGKPVASVLSLYHKDIVMPYWGGGTRAARTLRANDLLYFALMRHARARGCTRFDFGRSKSGTGAAAFKRNWGFVGIPLHYATRTRSAARSVNPLDPRYRLFSGMWRHMPLALANRLGPMISPGLA